MGVSSDAEITSGTTNSIETLSFVCSITVFPILSVDAFSVDTYCWFSSIGLDANNTSTDNYITANEAVITIFVFIGGR